MSARGGDDQQKEDGIVTEEAELMFAGFLGSLKTGGLECGYLTWVLFTETGLSGGQQSCRVQIHNDSYRYVIKMYKNMQIS